MLAYLNTGLFFLLLVPWSLRWIKYPKTPIMTFYHLMISHFYGTIAIAMLVLSADYPQKHDAGKGLLARRDAAHSVLRPPDSLPDVRRKGIDIRNVTPAWFIPPVGLIVVPLSGAPLTAGLSGSWKEIGYFINYFAWGSGFFLYMALFAIVMYRLIAHEPLPVDKPRSHWGGNLNSVPPRQELGLHLR